MALCTFFKLSGEGGRIRGFLQPHIKFDDHSAVLLLHNPHLSPLLGIGRQERKSGLLCRLDLRRMYPELGIIRFGDFTRPGCRLHRATTWRDALA